jgi:hypothetical protein
MKLPPERLSFRATPAAQPGLLLEAGNLPSATAAGTGRIFVGSLPPNELNSPRRGYWYFHPRRNIPHPAEEPHGITSR